MKQLVFTGEESEYVPKLPLYYSRFETPQELELLLSRLNVVDVGTFYLEDKIKKRPISPNYRGLCPFHRERTPSFYLKPAKNIYVCYGCNVAGGPLKLDYELGAEICTNIVRKAGIENLRHLIQPYLASDLNESQQQYLEVITAAFQREKFYYY